jgi:hypothetical protein
MGFMRYAVGALVGIGLTIAYQEYELASIEWQLHAKALFEEHHVAIAAVAGLLAVVWVLRLLSKVSFLAFLSLDISTCHHSLRESVNVRNN